MYLAKNADAAFPLPGNRPAVSAAATTTPRCCTRLRKIEGLVGNDRHAGGTKSRS